jgi:hypothetical protein
VRNRFERFQRRPEDSADDGAPVSSRLAVKKTFPRCSSSTTCETQFTSVIVRQHVMSWTAERRESSVAT